MTTEPVKSGGPCYAEPGKLRKAHSAKTLTMTLAKGKEKPRVVATPPVEDLGCSARYGVAAVRLVGKRAVIVLMHSPNANWYHSLMAVDL